MRVLLLANNWVGWRISQFLAKCDAEVIGLVLHVQDRASYSDEILSALRLRPEQVFFDDQLDSEAELERISKLNVDIGVSAFFGTIMKTRFLKLFPKGIVNLHPALLPHNRGSNPNVWSIVEGTPAGVTLHYVDAGIDTGDIIAQQEIDVLAHDTGETLYRKLEQACVQLFKDSWSLIENGIAHPQRQDLEQGSYHRKAELDGIDCIDLDSEWTARDLINVLRARTFPPFRGAYFIDKDRRVYLELKLTPENGGD